MVYFSFFINLLFFIIFLQPRKQLEDKTKARKVRFSIALTNRGQVLFLSSVLSSLGSSIRVLCCGSCYISLMPLTDDSGAYKPIMNRVWRRGKGHGFQSFPWGYLLSLFFGFNGVAVCVGGEGGEGAWRGVAKVLMWYLSLLLLWCLCSVAKVVNGER